MTLRTIALVASLALTTAAFAQTSTPASQLPDAPSAALQPKPEPIPTGPTAVFDTSMGRIACKLFDKEAPLAVASFIGLATGTKDWTDPTTQKKMHGKPMFNGTTFHRVIPGFMIQGGDPTGSGTGDPGFFVNDEIVPGLGFVPVGRLAMANSGPNTNGSQFFITIASTDFLTGHYTLFGQCDDAGVSVAQAIAAVPRNADDKPLTPVYLTKVTIVPVGKPLPPLPAGQPVQASAPAAPVKATPSH